MADPITAGVVASSLMPTVGAATAASIPALAGAGALAAPFAAAPALGVAPEFASLAMSGNPLVSAMGSGIAGNPFIGTSQIISGMNNPVSSGGFGQSILSSIGDANKFMNQNPITSQLGMQLAGSAFAPDQQMQMAPSGQINRSQIQPMDYMSLLNPQQQSVIRPPQISLLG
jgi:hypothetical protein